MSSVAVFSRKSALVLASIFLSIPLATHAASSLSISPLKFELTVEAGKSTTQTVKVTNTGDTPVTLYTSKEDFVSWDETGTPKFIKPDEKTTDTYSLARWVKIQNENLTLAQGETREVVLTIEIPKDGEPGGHYWAVFFSPGTTGGSQVSVLQRLGALLLINVPGNVVTSGKMTSFDIGTVSWSSIQPQTSFTSLPIGFETNFSNDGNTHLKPKGRIELIDANGEKLRNIGKETLTNEAGTYIGEQMVDYLPINDVGWNVLPKSKRTFLTEWNGFAYQILQKDGTKKVEFRTLQEYFANKSAEQRAYLQFWEKLSTRTVEKQITANMSISFTAKDGTKQDFASSKPFTIRYEESYVTLNWLAVSVILAFFSWIGFYVFVAVPRSREKLKRELLEQMRKNVQ